MDLDELIQQLLSQGLTVDEATAVAVARIKASRSQTAVTRAPSTHAVSAQQYGNGVDYGYETPQQAKERWMQQELEDPNGIFGAGATSGGVFGDGVISTDQQDPAAMQRHLSMQAQMLGVKSQMELLKLMREMRDQQQQLPPAEPPKQELQNGRGFFRRLGQKKRGNSR